MRNAPASWNTSAGMEGGVEHPSPSEQSWRVDAAGSRGYLKSVSKTSVEIDRDIAAQAAAILGTATLRDTINESLLEIVNAKRRLDLVVLLSEPGRFDFDAAEDAWGGTQ